MFSTAVGVYSQNTLKYVDALCVCSIGNMEYVGYGDGHVDFYL